MTAFEMTVSFSVPIESVNTSSDQSQDINFDVKYTGIVVEEAPKLKSVFYRQSYDWEEPHDNIEINYGFYVYRDRIYTDGTTYTDTICSPRFFPGFAIGGGYGDCLLNDERITEINDSITIDTSSQLVSEKYQDTDQVIIHGTVGVDDLSKFETRNVYREIADEVVIVGEQTLDDYEYWCGCLAENCEEPIEASTQNFQTTDLPNGWYMCRIVCYEQSNLRKGFYHWNDDFPDSYYVAFRWGCDFLFCTQLLVIDNKAITFDEWLPTGGPCDAYCEEYPAGYYKAKPGTTVLRDYFYNEATFLERKFFFEVETLLYERNPN